MLDAGDDDDADASASESLVLDPVGVCLSTLMSSAMSAAAAMTLPVVLVKSSKSRRESNKTRMIDWLEGQSSRSRADARGVTLVVAVVHLLCIATGYRFLAEHWPPTDLNSLAAAACEIIRYDCAGQLEHDSMINHLRSICSSVFHSAQLGPAASGLAAVRSHVNSSLLAFRLVRF